VTDAKQVIARQITRSGETLLLALEPLTHDEFYAPGLDGFSAAWVTGHLACVADLFSSWLDDAPLLLDAEFHQVFNETAVTGGEPDPAGKSAAAERYPKNALLLVFRRAVIKALRVLSAFDPSRWDAPPPPAVPVTLTAAGSVWELLAVHIWWHCGELAGSVPRFHGTYTLNIAPHHLYMSPEPPAPDRRPAETAIAGNGRRE
jgi:hypothetical protein